MTKNDLYAYLVKLGVNRGYSVIPEFRVNIAGRWKSVDLVWARTRNAKMAETTLDQWRLYAAFEIEGCNVRLRPAEFKRHLENFPHLRNVKDERIDKFVVLYTSAYDRAWNNLREREGEIAQCVGWAEGSGFQVLDGRRIEQHANKLPRARKANGG